MNIKICGLTSVAAVNMAADAGARYVGFVFFPKSPRHIDLITAAKLTQATPVGVAKVALTVSASNTDLDAIIEAMPLDMLQLHGKESPDRVADIRSRYGLPVMKAVGIADESDLPALLDYAAVADQILVDAKPPRNATLPGGNGLSFDWRLIHNRRWPVPWMLAGGLTPDNVAEAIHLTGATQVDVSSGVESSPGIKDAALVKAFIKAAI